MIIKVQINQQSICLRVQKCIHPRPRPHLGPRMRMTKKVSARTLFCFLSSSQLLLPLHVVAGWNSVKLLEMKITHQTFLCLISSNPKLPTIRRYFDAPVQPPPINGWPTDDDGSRGRRSSCCFPLLAVLVPSQFGHEQQLLSLVPRDQHSPAAATVPLEPDTGRRYRWQYQQ